MFSLSPSWRKMALEAQEESVRLLSDLLETSAKLDNALKRIAVLEAGLTTVKPVANPKRVKKEKPNDLLKVSSSRQRKSQTKTD